MLQWLECCSGSSAAVGGPSGPMPFAQVAAIGNKSIGPEGPPPTTRALPTRQLRTAVVGGASAPTPSSRLPRNL
ncbi:DUF6053 domain-containing protein [Lysobacter enzymogenes]|uniref:DUF6053 domain-containing protein n=1 Tax=Lysobacter enzymogenes TaxID=69 RepID=UPI003D187FFB